MKKLIFIIFMIMPFGTLFCKWEKVSDFKYIGFSFFLYESDNIIYSGSDRGLFISEDEGKNWKLLYDPRPYADLFTSMLIKDDFIYAGTDQGILLSSDKGKTWISKMKELNRNNVKCLVVNENYIFAGTQSDGIYRSSDKGVTWYKSNNGLNHLEVNALAVKGEYIFAGSGDIGGGVYRSSDNGENWTQHNTGFELILFLERLKCFFIEGDTIYAGVQGKAIYISINNGNSWIRHEFIHGPRSIKSIIKYRELFFSAGDKPFEIGLSRDNFKSMENFSEGLTTENPNGTLYPTNLIILNDHIYTVVNYTDVYRRSLLDVTSANNKSNEDINDVIIYPNPASDYITISYKPSQGLEPSEGYRVQIFDMLGLEVAQTPSSVNNMKNTQTGAPELLRIDVSHLPAGVYFIKIVGCNGACSIVEKFVKM